MARRRSDPDSMGEPVRSAGRSPRAWPTWFALAGLLMLLALAARYFYYQLILVESVERAL